MTNKIRHPEKVNKPSNPLKRKPKWIKSKIQNSKKFFATKTIINTNNLEQFARKQIALILQNAGEKVMQLLW